MNAYYNMKSLTINDSGINSLCEKVNILINNEGFRDWDHISVIVTFFIKKTNLICLNFF